MASRAADRAAMLAGAAVASRSAYPWPSALLAAGVNWAEARGGQGGEDAGMIADRVWYALASGQARADQVGGAPVAAGGEQVAGGFVVGGVLVDDFAGGGVDGQPSALEADWLGASAGRGDHLPPAREVGLCCAG